MLSKNELLEAAAHSKQNYAARVQESAAHLDSHEIYESMALYVLLAQAAMEGRYHIPPERPLVQIDIGSGSGRMLGAIATSCREKGKKCLLIGVEVNDILATQSAQRLREEGHAVAQHVSGKESVEQKARKTPVLRRQYPVHEEALERMDLSADQQIVIVQDDARKEMKATLAVLMKVREQGLGHVDQISWAFPGMSGDLAIQDSPDVHLGHDALLMRQSPKMVNEIADRTARLAYATLQKGGLLTLFQRLFKGAMFEEFCKSLTGESVPTEESALLRAKMLIAQVIVMRENAEKFNPKMGAVIFPDLHEAEAGTTLDYSGFNHNPGLSGTQQAKTAERDLFALSMVRSDLHVMGNTGALISTKKDRP